MIVEFLEKLNGINEFLFSGTDALITALNLPDWCLDAVLDTLHLIPVLFIIFLIIEIVEFFKADELNNLVLKSEKASTFIGSFLAIFPQCGFSVIASSLYIKRFITKGTLIAVFLATSDEAIPLILARPDKIHFLIPLVCVKLIAAIFFGYLVDFILKDDKYVFKKLDIDEPSGCCGHEITKKRKRDLVYHPLIHTLNISLFIFVVSLIINLFFMLISNNYILHNLLTKISIVAPIFTAMFGLIPNCAISIALTILLFDGSISFGAAMAGLLSNAGLGILVLLKNKDNYKDTFKIILILYVISVLCGFLIQLFNI